MRSNLLIAAIIVMFCAGAHHALAAGSTMWGTNHWLQQMDTNKDGVVSKEEFSAFMSRTFDRLDISHSGELGPSELAPLVRGSWPQKRAPSEKVCRRSSIGHRGACEETDRSTATRRSSIFRSAEPAGRAANTLQSWHGAL